MHLLNVLAAWEAIDGPTASTTAGPVPEAVLHAVYDVFPWQGAAGAGNGLHSAQRHFALQYRTLSNDLERTLEQVTVLRTDMVRLLNWLEERIDLIPERAAVQTHGINVCEAAAAAAPTTDHAAQAACTANCSLAAGKLAVLRHEEQRMQSMLANARERLLPLLPPPALAPAH